MPGVAAGKSALPPERPENRFRTASRPVYSTPDMNEAAALRTVVERPPPGPSRGLHGAPAWVVGSLGAAIALVALGHLARRLLGRGSR